MTGLVLIGAVLALGVAWLVLDVQDGRALRHLPRVTQRPQPRPASWEVIDHLRARTRPRPRPRHRRPGGHA